MMIMVLVMVITGIAMISYHEERPLKVGAHCPLMNQQPLRKNICLMQHLVSPQFSFSLSPHLWQLQIYLDLDCSQSLSTSNLRKR